MLFRSAAETRVPYVPRRARGLPPKRGCHMFHACPAKLQRNAGAPCSAQGPRTPAESRVPYVAVPRERGCHMFHARPAEPSRNAGALCCDPSETRVPYVPRVPRQTPQKRGCHMLRPDFIAGALSSTQGPRNPTEMQVHYVATLQKREFHMFHAGPAKSQQNQGALCCTPIFGSKKFVMHARPARPK